MRIIHVITTLDTGGAEIMLYRLLLYTDREKFEPTVISLTDMGPISERIQALGVTVHALGMRRGVPNPLGVLRLARLLSQIRPQIVQTWVYEADLIGGLAAVLAGSMPVAWGVHSSHFDPHSVKRIKIWTVRTCALTSHWLPTHIVCCSETSRKVHAKLGYSKGKMVVIPNGADTSTFVPNPEARLSVRMELGLEEGEPLIGLIARFDPMKDHRNFIQAASLLHARLPHANFILCGDGITWENAQLAEWIDKAGIRSRCYLLGRRQDMPRITAALDIASSSSYYGEAWPLVIGEAMSCGVPCVATDVGDSSLIVQDTGRVVPAKDPRALANAYYDLLCMRPDDKARLGMAARRRIEEHFDLASAINQYEELYMDLTLT